MPPCNRHPHLLSVLVRARCSLLIVHCSSHNFQGCCSPSRSSQDPLGSVRPNRAGALNILIPQRSLMVRGRHVSRPSTPHHTHTFHIHTLFFLSFTPTTAQLSTCVPRHKTLRHQDCPSFLSIFTIFFFVAPSVTLFQNRLIRPFFSSTFLLYHNNNDYCYCYAFFKPAKVLLIHSTFSFSPNTVYCVTAKSADLY